MSSSASGATRTVSGGVSAAFAVLWMTVVERLDRAACRLTSGRRIEEYLIAPREIAPEIKREIRRKLIARIQEAEGASAGETEARSPWERAA